jgi:S1-C subfamily serine protease
VPINTAKRIIPELMRDGRVARGWFGIAGQTQAFSRALARRLDLDVESGVLVAALAAKSPADQAGLRVGDVVLKLDGLATPSVDGVHKLLTRERIGRRVTLEVLRDGALLRLDLRVTERPKDPERA